MKITKKEYKEILQEVANRFVDQASVSLPEKLSDAMSKRWVEGQLDRFSSAEFKVTFSVKMVAGDLRQVLGLLRRRKGR